MKIYVNGVPSGTITNVSTDFAMPSGAGFLGANAGGGEAMVGRIFRVVVYAADVPEATIQKHADAFTSVLRPPIISSFTATPTEIIGQGSSVLKWQVQDATARVPERRPCDRSRTRRFLPSSPPPTPSLPLTTFPPSAPK